MGYAGKLELKKQAILLRKAGKSYKQIVNELHISKGTVSQWCKNVELTPDQITALYRSKLTGALKGSYIAAKNKKILVNENRKLLFEAGLDEVGKLEKRDRFMIGIALYAAEGTKTDRYCSFSNADPYLIKFMVNWFEEFCGVQPLTMKGYLWLHEGREEARAKEYWSRLTSIPQDNFYKTYITENKKDSKKIRKKIHEHGVFSFYVTKKAILRKLMGWIGGISGKPWYNNPT